MKSLKIKNQSGKRSLREPNLTASPASNLPSLKTSIPPSGRLWVLPFKIPTDLTSFYSKLLLRLPAKFSEFRIILAPHGIIMFTPFPAEMGSQSSEQSKRSKEAVRPADHICAH